MRQLRYVTALAYSRYGALVAVLDLQEEIKFTENVALDSGGGMVLRAVKSATVRCTSFERNVAYSGGGLKTSENGLVVRGRGFDFKECETSFEGNVAVNGGALHIEPRKLRGGEYLVRSMSNIHAPLD